MLGSFKKAIFRVLCLYCVLIGGGGLMAEPTHEELVLLGMLSYDKQDFSKAKGYFEKACDLNNGRGCNFLGFLYGSRKGVEKDLIKSAYLYSKTCELKEGDGCGALGALYYNGDGVKQDSKKAVALFEKACKLGYKKACEMLKLLR
ncbi:HcpA family protein [Helicobacter pylori]|nr:HcpA family protein [Helicobacter pylori]